MDLAKIATELERDRDRAVSRRLATLKAELGQIEREVVSSHSSPMLLEDFKLALDHMRSSVSDPDARRRVVAHFRLVRVATMMREVLKDLQSGTITPLSPGFEEVRSLIDQLGP